MGTQVKEAEEAEERREDGRETQSNRIKKGGKVVLIVLFSLSIFTDKQSHFVF